MQLTVSVGGKTLSAPRAYRSLSAQYQMSTNLLDVRNLWTFIWSTDWSFHILCCSPEPEQPQRPEEPYLSPRPLGAREETPHKRTDKHIPTASHHDFLLPALCTVLLTPLGGNPITGTRKHQGPKPRRRKYHPWQKPHPIFIRLLCLAVAQFNSYKAYIFHSTIALQRYVTLAG